MPHRTRLCLSRPPSEEAQGFNSDHRHCQGYLPALSIICDIRGHVCTHVFRFVRAHGILEHRPCRKHSENHRLQLRPADTAVDIEMIPYLPRLNVRCDVRRYVCIYLCRVVRHHMMVATARTMQMYTRKTTVPAQAMQDIQGKPTLFRSQELDDHEG